MSRVYDLLPVNAVLPEDIEQFALTMNGKRRKFRKKDFLAFVEKTGLKQQLAEKLIANIVGRKDECFRLFDEAYLLENMKKAIKEIISERIEILKCFNG